MMLRCESDMWLGNDGGIGLENDSLFTQLYN